MFRASGSPSDLCDSGSMLGDAACAPDVDGGSVWIGGMGSERTGCREAGTAFMTTASSSSSRVIAWSESSPDTDIDRRITLVAEACVERGADVTGSPDEGVSTSVIFGISIWEALAWKVRARPGLKV